MDNECLIKLLKLKNKIKHNGHIVILPAVGEFDDELILRVVWRIKPENFNYENVFSLEDLMYSEINFTELFIKQANDAIEEHIKTLK